jgi:hypothetical protein
VAVLFCLLGKKVIKLNSDCTGFIEISLSGEMKVVVIYTFMKCATLNVESFLLIYEIISGVRGSVVVKALCYKPEGRGFETR